MTNRVEQPAQRIGWVWSPQAGIVKTAIDWHLAEIPLDPPPCRHVTPIALEISADLIDVLDASELLDELIPAMRTRLEQELGIDIPAVHVRARALELGVESYRILIHDVPAASGALPSFDATSHVVGHLACVIRQNAAELIGIQEVSDMLEQLATSFPALVRETIPTIASVQELTEVLRRLVEEGLSVRDLRAILEAIARHGRDGVAELTEAVRRLALRRYIFHKYARGGDAVPVLTLDQSLEDELTEASLRVEDDRYLPLANGTFDRLIAALCQQLVSLPASWGTPVLLASPSIRRHVRKLIAIDLPDLAVISCQELPPHAIVRPLGHVELVRS